VDGELVHDARKESGARERWRKEERGWKQGERKETRERETRERKENERREKGKNLREERGSGRETEEKREKSERRETRDEREEREDKRERMKEREERGERERARRHSPPMLFRQPMPRTEPAQTKPTIPHYPLSGLVTPDRLRLGIRRWEFFVAVRVVRDGEGEGGGGDEGLGLTFLLGWPVRQGRARVWFGEFEGK
jgi:hypothetical protein